MCKNINKNRGWTENVSPHECPNQENTGVSGSRLIKEMLQYLNKGYLILYHSDKVSIEDLISSCFVFSLFLDIAGWSVYFHSR